MNMNRVVLICGDDIYYEKHDFEMMSIFREKGKNNYTILNNMSKYSFTNNAYYNTYDAEDWIGSFGK